MAEYVKTFESYFLGKDPEADIKFILESLNEEYESNVELYENLTLTVDKLDDAKGVLYVKINDKKYGYSEKPGVELALKDIKDKLEKIMKYSHGKALVWLKKNTALAFRPQDEIKTEDKA